MGLTITRDRFDQQEYDLFNCRVRENLRALAALLERDEFGAGASSLGAELELYLIDEHGKVAPINKQVIADCNDPRLQPELNRFNLEYNVDPVATRGVPFSILEQRIDSAISALRDSAARHRARVIATGILPTLESGDLGTDAMTDEPRYRALAAGLTSMRNGPFSVDIDGQDPIELTNESVTLEGANTSLQVHWRVDPKQFADTFNAVQMATPLALAIGANSPLLMGHRLWDETRIALFKQSIDYRSHFDHGWQLPSRIPFGFGWVRSGALELFAETAALFPPLLPITGDEESLAVVTEGGTPRLDELRLHHGTVWSWNRAIYDPADNGHLRIEMRALPAGPTTRDMTANAALLIGLAEALRPTINQLLPALPYRYAEYNFYRAAKFGLQARLIWRVIPVRWPKSSLIW